jgi:hypothetical protein
MFVTFFLALLAGNKNYFPPKLLIFDYFWREFKPCPLTHKRKGRFFFKKFGKIFNFPELLLFQIRFVDSTLLGKKLFFQKKVKKNWKISTRYHKFAANDEKNVIFFVSK